MGTTKAAATFVKPEKVAPENRKGSSTIKFPVARTWVECINLTAKSGGIVKRSQYHKAAIAIGVTWYTVRTQVDKYLRWEDDGRAGALPRGVTLG